MSPMIDAQRRTEIRVAVLMPSMLRSHYQPVLRELTRRFPKTVIFTGRLDGLLPGCEGCLDIRQLSGFRFITWKHSDTGAVIGFGLVPPLLLWELLKFRPAVVISSTFTLWTVCALLLKALTGCRVLVDWEGTAATYEYLNSPVRLAIRRAIAYFVDGFHTNTLEGMEYLRKVIGVPEFKISVMRTLVPEIAGMCIRQGREGDLAGLGHPMFLFVGSLIKRKGPRHLIVAARKLKELGAGKFSVVLVGDGDEAEELRELVCALQLQHEVRLLGQVPYHLLGFYFRSCDVFVLPTLEDTWAMVVPEALSFGKPVLCSKYAGAKELVEPGVNGFTFDPHESEELVGYMARFIHDPALATEFGARAAQTMVPYTPARSGELYEHVIAKALHF
jgi:glycosyltransferase involved in cell wall biosynthesis